MVGPGTNLWSADGNYNVSADGAPGWSADGYEPTSFAVAVADLAAFGVNVGTITYELDPLVPVGYVITGYVPYLNPAYAGQAVNLVISSGPPVPPRVVTVPNVVGMYYYDAQLAILNASLLTAPPVWVLAPTVLPGYVTSQSIAAGNPVTLQALMSITVSGFPVINQPGIVVPVP
jgi:beta-lactam-binding protein with PASTA domain